MELGVDLAGAADQIDAQAEIARSRQGAIDWAPWSMIAAHRVNRDAHGIQLVSGSNGRHHRERPDTALIVIDWTHLARAVETAVRAHAVSGLRLAALRAQAGRGGLERVVSAALTAAGLGVSAFWIRHRRAFAS